MKLKSKLMYILSFIISLYTSYLICRLYNLNTLGNTCIVFFNILATEYVTYLWNKNIKFDEIIKKAKKKTKIIIAFVTVIISIFILLFNFDLFTKKYSKANVIIHSDEIIDGSVIKSLYINNVFYNVNYNRLVDSSENDIYDSSVGMQITQLDEHNVEIVFEKSINIKLILNKEDGNISINDGDFSSTVIFENDTYEYNVRSNCYRDNIFILRTGFSLITIMYIAGLLVIAIKNLDSDKRCELISAIIAAITGWFCFRMYTIADTTNDSIEYIYWNNFLKIFQGKLKERVPFYPLIIKLSKIIFQMDYLRFVCIIQYIIWFVSIIYLYKLLRLLIKNRKIVMFFTIIYTLCPAIIDWNNVILTESIALSGTIILVYLIVKYLKEPNVKIGAMAIILAFILTFLRPTAIIYVLILEIFWIMRFILDRKNIKKDLICFSISTFTILLIVIYAIIFHKTYGIYSITSVVPRQQLFVCMYEGFYKNSDNEQYIKEIEQAFINNPDSSWRGMEEVLFNHTYKETQDFTKECISKSIPQYINYFIRLNKENLSVKFSNYSFKIVNSKLQWLSNTLMELFTFVTFAHSYLAIFIEFILLIYLWIKDKKVPWIHFGLFAFPLIIIVSSFVGTCAEYMRTAICALPFTYISLAIFADMLFSCKIFPQHRSFEDLQSKSLKCGF